MIQLSNISKKFGETQAARGISLMIPDGSVFGLLGSNGAGKSTLLRMMAGILKEDAGEILVDGDAVFDNPEIKQNLFYLSDAPYYFSNATLQTMKEFYQTLYPQFDQDGFEMLIRQFNLNENKRIRTFSKGMKRQAFILIALAISPKLLLLDESFDGLDPMMRLLFKRAISECIEKKNMTIIISSHNLRELEDICDSFGILDDHKITTSGMLDETKENIHKIQLAFSIEKQRSDFSDLDILHYSQTSRVITMVVKGDLNKIEGIINAQHPLMMDVLNVNLEEIFIYEMEKKGYGVYDE